MTMISRARNELGYVEKSRRYYQELGSVCLWPKLEYAGWDNYNKYAVIAGHPQAQPWCMTFIVALAIMEYGKPAADVLFCGKAGSASTMEVKDAMVRAGREVPLSEALPEDIVFRSRNGGGHVGIVESVKNGQIVTIEGNSSDVLEYWNGGEVVRHTGARWEWCCRPDYHAVSWHWVKSGGLWYYQDADGNNAHGWQLIPDGTDPTFRHWYWFDGRGAAVTGIQTIEDSRYYFSEEGPLECALCATSLTGALSPWYIKQT